MGNKLRPASFDCYQKALPDEPMFTLLARDPSAPNRVRQWARDRQNEIAEGRRPETDAAMVVEALQCADDMESWRRTNEGVWRQIVPEDNRHVSAPWTPGAMVLVTFEAGEILVNGKRAGEALTPDESTVWTAFHNRYVAADKS